MHVTIIYILCYNLSSIQAMRGASGSQTTSKIIAIILKYMDGEKTNSNSKIILEIALELLQPINTNVRMYQIENWFYHFPPLEFP